VSCFFNKDIGKCRGFPYVEMGFLAALDYLESVAKFETVQGNYEGFAKCDVNKAVLACKAQAMVGSPSAPQFAELVSENCNALKIIPVTYSDLTNAHHFWSRFVRGVWKNCKTETREGRNRRNPGS